MGTFLKQPTCRLAPGRTGAYTHWFGGEPSHSGVIPSGRAEPVHLLYDLDLTDPALGLASRFPGLSRLPLYNALQYNCCDMIYRVVSDDTIEILEMGEPEKTKWDADFPFDDYPRAFPRTPVHLESVPPELVERCIAPLAPDGGADVVRSDVLNDSCMFPRVGGRHFMWQGIPPMGVPDDRLPAGRKARRGRQRSLRRHLGAPDSGFPFVGRHAEASGPWQRADHLFTLHGMRRVALV